MLNYFRKRHHGRHTNRIPYSATLILDSMTALEEAIHRQIQQDGIPVGKNGQPDGFHLWKLKIDYLNDFFAIAQAWPGTFICIMHETPEVRQIRRTTGELSLSSPASTPTRSGK